MTRSSTTLEWSVCQRGDTGAWLVRYKDPASGKWKDKRIPVLARVRTKKAAEEWARSWLDHEATAPDAHTETLRSYFSRWAERRERNPKVRGSTLANNRSHFTHYIEPVLGRHLLADLTPARLRAFVADLRDASRASAKDGGKLAALTVRNVAATLRGILDSAFDEGLLRVNPMRSKGVREELPEPVRRAGSDTVVHLEKPYALCLLQSPSLPTERRARYLLALLSGLRDGEIAGLTAADLHFDADVQFVGVTKSVDTNWQLGPPKNKNAIRKVPLHHLAAAALADWLSGGFVVLLGHEARPTDPVFPMATGRHYRPKSAALLRTDLLAAGCSADYQGNPLDFHALRRSFATWLADAGVSEGLRKRLLGHGTSDVTDGHYTAKTMRALQAAVESIALDLVTPDPVRLLTDGHAAFLAALMQQAQANDVLELGGSAWESNPPDPGINRGPIGFEDRGPRQRTKRFR